MDDVIYRQKAIDELWDMYSKVDDDGYTWVIRTDAVKRIEAMPSAQQWIPCSERLPEEGTPVLGSFDDEGSRFILPTSIFVFDEEEGKAWTGTMGLKPIAWMPLPEPYKGKTDG